MNEWIYVYAGYMYLYMEYGAARLVDYRDHNKIKTHLWTTGGYKLGKYIYIYNVGKC